MWRVTAGNGLPRCQGYRWVRFGLLGAGHEIGAKPGMDAPGSSSNARNCMGWSQYRSGVVAGPIGWRGGQWFSEPAFGGPAERPGLLGEPGFWVETTTEEVDPQSGGVDCRDPGFR